MSGHGHVTPNPDGRRARCGGPPMCPVCNQELATHSAARLNVPTMTIDDIRRWHANIMSPQGGGMVEFHDRERQAHAAIAILLGALDHHQLALTRSMNIHLKAHEQAIEILETLFP